MVVLWGLLLYITAGFDVLYMLETGGKSYQGVGTLLLWLSVLDLCGFVHGLWVAYEEASDVRP